ENTHTFSHLADASVQTHTHTATYLLRCHILKQRFKAASQSITTNTHTHIAAVIHKHTHRHTHRHTYTHTKQVLSHHHTKKTLLYRNHYTHTQTHIHTHTHTHTHTH